MFEQRTSLSDAQATALGFDMARLTTLIEREIDAPLRWMPYGGNLGEPPAGYELRTRIQGRARRSDWLTYVGLDVERCRGNTCYDADYGELECSDRLELGVEVELRTLDGAINATAAGYVLQGRPGFSFATPAGSQRADLRDVTGSLEVFPPPSPPIRVALLMIDLFFEDDRIEGICARTIISVPAPAPAPITVLSTATGQTYRSCRMNLRERARIRGRSERRSHCALQLGRARAARQRAADWDSAQARSEHLARPVTSELAFITGVGRGRARLSVGRGLRSMV